MNNSLLKALDLLDVFTTTDARLSLTEISRRLGLPKSTTHRILATLHARGFVERLENDDYGLGTAIVALGQTVRVNVEVRDRAATIARALAERCQESIYVAVLEGDHVLYIYAIETSQRLAARTAVGDRAPLYCTGVGKACLAMLATDDPALLDGIDLPPITPNTITDTDELRAELRDIRERGYSVDREEHEDGTYCTAAPFFGADGRVVGAISISGRHPEIAGSRLPELSQAVGEAAGQISSRLGYVAPRPSDIAGRYLIA